MSVGNVAAQPLHGTLRATTMDRWLLAQLYSRVAPAPLRFVLWDGSWAGAREPLAATIIIRDRVTLARVCANADLNFGEAYMQGRLEIATDNLGDALTVLYEGLQAHLEASARAPRAWWWRRLASRPSPRRSRANVHHHYDVGNEFYRLLARRAHALHLRLLPVAGRERSRRHSSRSWSTSAASCACGRASACSRRAAAGARSRSHHGPPPRGARARLQRLARAGRLRARARREGGARGARRVRRGRLPEHRRPLRRLRLGRHARARRGRVLPDPRRRDRARPRSPTAAA